MPSTHSPCSQAQCKYLMQRLRKSWTTSKTSPSRDLAHMILCCCVNDGDGHFCCVDCYHTLVVEVARAGHPPSQTKFTNYDMPSTHFSRSQEQCEHLIKRLQNKLNKVHFENISVSWFSAYDIASIKILVALFIVVVWHASSNLSQLMVSISRWLLLWWQFIVSIIDSTSLQPNYSN